MKKTVFSIDYYKSLYMVMKRNCRVVIAGLVIAASIVCSPDPQADTITNIENIVLESIPIRKTDIVDESRLPISFVNKVTTEIVSEKETERLQNWEREIESLASLPDDWDGEGSAAVQEEAIKDATALLEFTREFSDILDSVYPTSFGSICMEWGAGNNWVNVEIASTGIGFYHDRGDDATLESGEFDSLDGQCMKCIKQHLKRLKDELAG